MFKKTFADLQQCFKNVLIEYERAKKVYGVKIVMCKSFSSLPAGFIKEREEILTKYSDVFDEKIMVFKNLDLKAQEDEVLEAMDVFSSIELREEFKVFFDIFAYMPSMSHKLIFQQLLGEKHVGHLKKLMNKVHVAGDTTLDMDEGCCLSASGNHILFGKVLIILSQMSDADENCVLSPDRMKDESLRMDLASQILKEKGF